MFEIHLAQQGAGARIGANRIEVRVESERDKIGFVIAEGLFQPVERGPAIVELHHREHRDLKGRRRQRTAEERGCDLTPRVVIDPQIDQFQDRLAPIKGGRTPFS